MDRRFVGILAAIIIIFVGIFAISQHSNNNGGSSSSGTPTNHVEGNGAKHVTLVEYGDYECPVCEAYYQPVKAAVATYSNDIYFQFRNLPLSAIHQNAFAGARAAEAAGMQNKYWQMHDALYDNQNAWASLPNPLSAFETYAKDLGLNVAKFDTDYKSDQVNNNINADINAFLSTSYAGHDVKKEATPTFFLDGTYLSNANLIGANGLPTADKIGAAIQAEISKKNPQ